MESVKAGIMAFLVASADVEAALPRASWFGGPTDYYLEIGMLVSEPIMIACLLSVAQMQFGAESIRSEMMPGVTTLARCATGTSAMCMICCSAICASTIMQAHCVKEQAATYGDFRQRMLWGAEEAIRAAGAKLAVPTALYYQDKLPPAPKAAVKRSVQPPTA